jgi:hypothetical protein
LCGIWPQLDIRSPPRHETSGARRLAKRAGYEKIDGVAANTLSHDMLLPRFTLRSVLAATAACAVLFLFVGIASRGETWAWGVTIGMLSLGVVAVVQAMFFGVVWCFAQLFTTRPPATSSGSRPAQQPETNA